MWLKSRLNFGHKPNSPFARQIRRDSWWVVFWLVLFVVSLSYLSPRLITERLDNLIYDFQQRLQPVSAVPTDPPIVLISIDNHSLKTLGHWPWRRAVYAQLLEQLEEAKVVGLDLLFSNANPAYPDDDRLLAQAMTDHGRVVLPIYINEHDEIEEPVPALRDSASGLGFINIQPDADGVVRRIQLQRTAQQQQLHHFSTAMLSAAKQPRRPQLSGLPFDQPQLARFNGPLGSFPNYPFVHVLNGDIPPETFKDKYVLIGAWSSGLGDFYPTPFSTSENTSMSGVEILANMVHNQLYDQWIHTVPDWLKALANTLPVLFIFLALRQLSPRIAFFCTLVVVVTVFLGSWLLLHVFYYWIPIGSALVGSIIAYPLWYWRSQETVLRYIDKQLSDLRRHNPGLSQALDVYDVQLTLPARLNHLYRAIEFLREAEQRREETLRFLSHDMRAPQNSILALVAMQRQQANPDDPQSTDPFLHKLEQYACNTLDLVDDFLDLARVESSAFELRPLVINDLLSQALDDVWPLATNKHIQLNYDEPDHSIWILGHQSFLQRALTNLLDNAIKYSSEYTSIFCSIAITKEEVVLRIQDQGWGIPKEELASIFSAFKRLHTDVTDNPKGTGLGLAFVHTVVQRHRGRIEVKSTIGKGTVFQLSFPLRPVSH